MRYIAALLFAVLVVPALSEETSTFPYEHPELDRTPPTVPETADLGDGERRMTLSAAAYCAGETTLWSRAHGHGYSTVAPALAFASGSASCGR